MTNICIYVYVLIVWNSLRMIKRQYQDSLSGMVLIWINRFLTDWINDNLNDSYLNCLFCSFSICFTITKFFIAFTSFKFVFKPILCLLNDMSFIFKHLFSRFCIAFFAYVYGYFCSHHVFYRLDVNECIERRMCPGYCENTIGSYICTSKNRLKIDPYEDCPPGYQWESTTGLCSGI